MSSKARATFEQNRADILLLWSMHREVSGSGQKRERRVEVLNRAAFVFVSACWESFIEDVAVEAFDYLLTHAATPRVVPAKVRAVAARHLREDKDERRVWDLAGDGWRTTLQQHRDALVSKWIKDFNTPKSEQVCALFAGLLDLSTVSSSWSWKDVTPREASERLDNYMTIRGNIAHRTKHTSAVYKSWAKAFLSHVARLVDKTDEAVSAHLATVVGTPPW